jgi:hypothetical protein
VRPDTRETCPDQALCGVKTSCNNAAMSKAPAGSDLSTWLTKRQAAHALATSEKTVDRYVTQGLLQVAYRPTPGQRPAAVYPPDQVKELVAKYRRVIVAEEMPATAAVERSGSGSEAQALTLYAAMLQQLVQRPADPPAPLWVTLDQAAAISGLSVGYLRRAIKEGQLAAVRDRNWKVRIADLQKL